jgi:hypothetical protein
MLPVTRPRATVSGCFHETNGLQRLRSLESCVESMGYKNPARMGTKLVRTEQSAQFLHRPFLHEIRKGNQ